MKEKTTEEVLNRVDKYLSLMRHQYSSQEKLARLNLLNDYYESLHKMSSVESVSSKIECPEQLAKDLVLPLKVRGVFLTEGKPKARYYKGEHLKASVSNPLNSSFPLMLDHKEKEVSMIIGQVDKIWYDSGIKGLRWKGHINDETHARNVVDGTVTDVSATIYSNPEFDEELQMTVWSDLVFKELSLVMEGAVAENFIEVDED